MVLHVNVPENKCGKSVCIVVIDEGPRVCVHVSVSECGARLRACTKRLRPKVISLSCFLGSAPPLTPWVLESLLSFFPSFLSFFPSFLVFFGG